MQLVGCYQRWRWLRSRAREPWNVGLRISGHLRGQLVASGVEFRGHGCKLRRGIVAPLDSCFDLARAHESAALASAEEMMAEVVAREDSVLYSPAKTLVFQERRQDRKHLPHRHDPVLRSRGIHFLRALECMFQHKRVLQIPDDQRLKPLGAKARIAEGLKYRDFVRGRAGEPQHDGASRMLMGHERSGHPTSRAGRVYLQLAGCARGRRGIPKAAGCDPSVRTHLLRSDRCGTPSSCSPAHASRSSPSCAASEPPAANSAQ